jgi:hypothetical protein
MELKRRRSHCGQLAKVANLAVFDFLPPPAIPGAPPFFHLAKRLAMGRTRVMLMRGTVADMTTGLPRGYPICRSHRAASRLGVRGFNPRLKKAAKSTASFFNELPASYCKGSC